MLQVVAENLLMKTYYVVRPLKQRHVELRLIERVDACEAQKVVELLEADIGRGQW